jgi:hypothetical protein
MGLEPPDVDGRDPSGAAGVRRPDQPITYRDRDMPVPVRATQPIRHGAARRLPVAFVPVHGVPPCGRGVRVQGPDIRAEP